MTSLVPIASIHRTQIDWQMFLMRAGLWFNCVHGMQAPKRPFHRGKFAWTLSTTRATPCCPTRTWCSSSTRAGSTIITSGTHWFLLLPPERLIDTCRLWFQVHHAIHAQDTDLWEELEMVKWPARPKPMHCRLMWFLCFKLSFLLAAWEVEFFSAFFSIKIVRCRGKRPFFPVHHEHGEMWWILVSFETASSHRQAANGRAPAEKSVKTFYFSSFCNWTVTS